MKTNNFIVRIENAGTFNNWKGYIGLYFTKKELRQIAKETGVKSKDIEDYKLIEIYQIMKDNMTSIIEAAFWAGFEPSSEDLTFEALYAEAEEYLMKSTQY